MIPETDIFAVASGAWNAFGIFFIILLGGGFLLFLTKYIMDKKAYNKKAIIFRKFGNTRSPIIDLFKYVYDKKRNLKYYHGKKSKAQIPADIYEIILKDSDNKECLLIDNPAPGEFYPMAINNEKLDPIMTANKKAWYIYAQKDNAQRFEILDWIAKYATVIALAGIVILMMINFIFQGAVIDKMNGAISMQNEFAKSLSVSSETMLLANEIMYQTLFGKENLTKLLIKANLSSGTVER